MFFVAEEPVPVLNTPRFELAFGGKSGRDVFLGFLEFIALQGMVFSIEKKLPRSPICQVSSPLYPAKELYIDSRFGKTSRTAPPYAPLLPSRSAILSHMTQLLGKPYIWGGNWSRGIPKLLELYPPKEPIDPRTRTFWTLDGVDCSGLLYEAAQGATPRNTSGLFRFGSLLPIAHLNPEAILPQLQPLDMILHSGHVLFVKDSKRTIESRSPFGVIESDLFARLEEVKIRHGSSLAIRRMIYFS